MTTPAHIVIRGHLERDQGFVYAVCDNAPVFVWSTDEDTALTVVADAMALFLGELSVPEWQALAGSIPAGTFDLQPVNRSGDRFDAIVAL